MRGSLIRGLVVDIIWEWGVRKKRQNTAEFHFAGTPAKGKQSNWQFIKSWVL